MATSMIICSLCGTSVEKENREINRARKKGRKLYCSLACAAQAGNLPRRAKEIVLTCPGCGKQFKTTTHNKAKRHCSRSCASKASMSEDRRESQRAGGLQTVGNLLSPAETLKRREGWKYAALREALAESGRDFEFEFALGDRVFDLALKDVGVLVEFDGPYHTAETQQDDDSDKDALAEAAGFTIVRRAVLPATVIDPDTLEGL